jgi:predicted NBD/HSP70 family sugar kinase
VTLSDFAYIFLGAGLGAAIISNGKIIRGHAGLAGEIAHVITVGPQGQAMRFIDLFGALELTSHGSTAIDTGRLLSAATCPRPQAAAIRQTLGQAVSGVLAAVVALTDSKLIIIGGPWGSHPVILKAISAATACLPRPVPSQPAELTDEPALTGVRTEALSCLRSAIIAAARRARPTSQPASHLKLRELR